MLDVRRMATALGLLGLALAQGAGAAELEVARVAVVVGYNGSAQRADLRFADDDAARYYELLAPGMDRAWLLTGLDDASQEVFGPLVPIARLPTLEGLKAALLEAEAELAAAKQRGVRTELTFVYAGHGDVSDGTGYVNLQGSRLSRPQFEALVLDGLSADRIHVIIDACRSYFLVSSRGPGGIRTPASESYAGPRRRPGVGYVLSTSSDAESHEWADFQGGVFSHEVRSALTGAADLDGDGNVDYQELAAFVAVANEGIPQARYRPRFFIQPPSEDKTAPILRGGRVDARWLELPPSVVGRIRVTDARGVPYADLNKAAGDSVRVALVAGGPHTISWNDRHWKMAEAVERADITQLSPAPADGVAARTQPHEAFRFLFTTPMSSDVLRGWRLGARLTAPAPAAPEKRRWLPPTLVGSGLALAAGGTALLVAGAESRSGLSDPSLSQVDRIARAEDGDLFIATGIATAATGVVVGAIGGWLWASD